MSRVSLRGRPEGSVARTLRSGPGQGPTDLSLPTLDTTAGGPPTTSPGRISTPSLPGPAGYGSESRRTILRGHPRRC